MYMTNGLQTQDYVLNSAKMCSEVGKIWTYAKIVTLSGLHVAITLGTKYLSPLLPALQ